MGDFLSKLLSGKKKKAKISFQEHFDYFKTLNFGTDDLFPKNTSLIEEDYIKLSSDIDKNLDWLEHGSLINADTDYSDFEVPVWGGDPQDSEQIDYLENGQKVKVIEIENNYRAKIQWENNGQIQTGYIEPQFLKSQRDELSDTIPVVIRPHIHLMRIKQLIEQYKGFSGVRKRYRSLSETLGSDDDIKSEIVLMLQSFDRDEEYDFLHNDASVKYDDYVEMDYVEEVTSLLDARQLARGIAGFDLSLNEKLELLEKTGDTEIEYQSIRPLLLTSQEGRVMDEKLKSKLNPDDEIKLTDLKSGNLSSIESEKKDGLLFDDQSEETDIIVTESEKNLLLYLSKRAEAYRRFKIYDQKIFLAKGYDEMKSSLEKELADIGYSDIESFEKDLEAKKEEYLKTFQLYAIKTAYQALDESEKALKDQSNALLEKSVGEKLKEVLKSQESLYDRVKKQQEEIDALINRVSNYSGRNAGNTANLLLMGMNLQEDLAKYSEMYKALRENKILLRQNLGQRFPLFLDPKLDLDEIYEDFVKDDELSEDLVDLLRETMVAKYENIEVTRSNLREDPDLVWKLEGLINLTLEKTNPLHDEIFNDLVKEKVESVKASQEMINTALMAISIGLAIASFGTASPVAAGVYAGIGLGVSALDYYVTSEDYKKISPASNTSLDPGLALSNESPSVVWVILSAAGALGDVMSLVRVANQAEVFAQLGETALKNLSSRKNSLIKKVHEAFEQGKLVGKAVESVERFFEVLEAVHSLRNHLAARFLGKFSLEDFNKGLDLLLSSDNGDIGTKILAKSYSNLENDFVRMISRASFENRGKKAISNIAQTGKNTDEFESFVKSLPDKSLGGEAQTAINDILKRMYTTMKPEEAGRIADFLLTEFKVNPHLTNEWSGFLKAITKNIGDDSLNLLRTARRLRSHIADKPELFIKVGDRVAEMGLAEKRMFLDNMGDIMFYIKDKRSILREAGLLDEVLTDLEVQNFIRYNMDDPKRIVDLWKTYKAKPEVHLTFRSYIDKFEADRLGKIQKVKGEYPINAQDYAGKTFSFNLNKNRRYYDRIEAETNISKRQEKIDLFRSLNEKYPEGVKFNDKGFPEFGKYVYQHKGVLLEVDITVLNPNKVSGSNIDIDNANLWVKNNIDKDWIEEPLGYTWHHIENSTKLVLIPTDMHTAIRHVGGRGTMD